MYRIIKRIFDIMFAAVLLIIMCITFPFIAVGIKISSPGPIFYISERAGKDGVPFRFYKYRSMHIDVGKTGDEQQRVFAFGKILRRTKLDEIPQAINLMRGEISVVGPRPMLMTNVSEVYGGHYYLVQKVKPGLTSYASLFDYTHGDACVKNIDMYNATILPIKQELELYYIKKASIVTDTVIIVRTAKTILSVIFGKNNFAYPKEYYIVKENLKKLHKMQDL